MNYRPRPDCSDVPADSDDRWLTTAALFERVDAILDNQADTVGFAEMPLALSVEEKRRRLASWEPSLRQLGRLHDDEHAGPLYHWSVAEFLAHDALAEFWSSVVNWPLGWWPWAARREPRELAPAGPRRQPGSLVLFVSATDLSRVTLMMEALGPSGSWDLEIEIPPGLPRVGRAFRPVPRHRP